MISNLLQNNPIIAAVNDVNKFDRALSSPCKIIFLLTGSILNLSNFVKRADEVDKKVFIHIDLMDGITKDSVGLKYIQKNINPYGIISTRSSLIKRANEAGFYTIQRIFLLDSISVEKGIKDVKNAKPHAIELVPGVVDKITSEISHKTKIPVITGGLIKEKKEVINSLKAGAVCISTSREEIWHM